MIAAGHCAVPPERVSLLRDTSFERGFTLLSPKPGSRVELGAIMDSPRQRKPDWLVAQWSSRFPLTPEGQTRDGASATNQARWLRMITDSASKRALELGVDSRPEYGGVLRSNASQPWPHLLVEQDITNCPTLSQLQSIALGFEARLSEAQRFESARYSPGLHAAQFQFVLILQNRNRASKGFGDFLWFVVPVYDDRHPVPPRYVAEDFADPSAKLINNPGAAPFAASPVTATNWVAFKANLRPHLLEALQTAGKKGYLRDSTDPADFQITSANMGWEVPGLNRVGMLIRNLHLDVEAQPPAASN